MWRYASICVLILSIFAAPAVVADWTWPERMKIGGVTVANIRGSVNADGSGTATGKVQAVDVGVRLVRSARGEISGSGSASFAIGGAEVQGMGVVGSGGFRVTGSVQGSVKTITDAAMSVNDEGRIQGSGRVFLGGLAAPVSFNISRSGFTYRGSVPVEAQSNTPLALYNFRGSISLDGGVGSLGLVASGTVVRKGKLADQTTNYSVSGIAINLSDGSGSADVSGVRIRFKFF